MAVVLTFVALIFISLVKVSSRFPATVFLSAPSITVLTSSVTFVDLNPPTIVVRLPAASTCILPTESGVPDSPVGLSVLVPVAFILIFLSASRFISLPA